MFSEQQRHTLREDLIAEAEADPRITAAAVVGSAASGREDRWSDIDLALRLDDPHEPAAVADSWTKLMYAEHNCVDHLDIWSGSALYRVFLLADSLQVDLSFWPDDMFAQAGPSFALLFGTANPPREPVAADPRRLVGMAWLYALHARSSIARARRHQARLMISGIHDQTVMIACLRHTLPSFEGRGVDDLPSELLDALATAMPRALDTRELQRGFAATVALLLTEATHVDPELADRLRGPLAHLLVPGP